MENPLKNIRQKTQGFLSRYLAMAMALVLSTTLVMAQSGKKKTAKTTQKREFTKKPISSHRNSVKGKQREHSSYRGNDNRPTEATAN
jgi:hypothetical protein